MQAEKQITDAAMDATLSEYGYSEHAAKSLIQQERRQRQKHYTARRSAKHEKGLPLFV